MGKKVFIGLGSNQGERHRLMEHALVEIILQIGKITHCSSLYESAAWGFEAPPFLNACVAVETQKNPQEVLTALLAIEKQLGRIRQNTGGYQSRPIDLDVLCYAEEVHQSPGLEIPHPRWHLRNFVLAPMEEIAPDYLHPVLKKTSSELLKQSTDPTAVRKIGTPDWGPHFLRGTKKFIVLEGNIGAGKTTMTQRLQAQFELPALYENFSDNPHLEAFYKAPEQHALAVETHFLKDRCKAYSQFFKTGIPQGGAVADYTFLKSNLFASQTLGATDFRTFQKTFQVETAHLQHPDLLVYIHKPVSELLEQIKKRGRTYEQQIQTTYLKKIESRYHQFLDKTSLKVLYIDAAGLDYVADLSAYQKLLAQLIVA